MKISILTPDFSSNCFGRAWLLAKLLQNHYQIEVIGPAFNDRIWKPLEDSCDFELKMVKGYANGRFQLKKMLRMITGDIIYASKPLMASFGVGLLKRIITKKPLALDVDDWELHLGSAFDNLSGTPRKLISLSLSVFNIKSYFYNKLLDIFVPYADFISVSSQVLRSNYGGTVVYHCRNANNFRPDQFRSSALRRKHLPENVRNHFIIGFIGSPRPHKGLEDLIDALSLLDNKTLSLMVVGTQDDSYCANLKKRVLDLALTDRVIFFPVTPFDKLPEFLSITDLVVIPQRQRPASYGQVPAKIFDAMAMARPIIATDTSDIPEILNGCGWIVGPENPAQLAEKIQYVYDHYDDARKLGTKAREKLISHYNYDTFQNKLVNIFENIGKQ